MDEYIPLVLRMVTGEDVISDAIFINEAGNKKYILNNPLKIVYMPITKGTHLSISLMQWMFSRISDNQNFEVDERNVMMITEPTESLTDYYYKTVEYFDQVQEEKKKSSKSTEAELYKEAAMSDDEELLDSDEMNEIQDYLSELSKKNKGTLH